jgi:hypothetical protein
MNSALRAARNALGKQLGYGACYHCGDSWRWKRSCDIRYEPGSAMFPICRECFDELPPEAIIEHCQKLWDFWAGLDPKNEPPEKFPLLIIAKSVELEKSGRGQYPHPMFEDDIIEYRPCR